MSWKRREGTHKENRGEADDFTIQMHHGGKFVDLGSRVYVGGQIDHFDNCNADMMSMREIHTMSVELGHYEVDGSNVLIRYFHNLERRSYDCSSRMKELVSDLDAMDMVNFIDDDRVVDVFVEHIHSRDGTASLESDYNYDNIPEEDIEVDEDIETNIEQETQTNVEDNIESNMAYDSDSAEQSYGEDSDHSDRLYDSEYDDDLYDQNIDVDIEWDGDVIYQSAIAKAPTIQTREREEKSEYNSSYPLLFNPKVDMEDPQFVVGLCFSSTQILRETVRRHSMKHGRDIIFKKNDPDRIKVKCKDEDCGWMMYASYKHDEKTMQIKTLGAEHSCCRQSKVRAANSKFVAKKYHDHIRTNLSWPIKSMMTIAQLECQLEFSRFQMYRARNKGLEQASGSELEQFGKIWDYAQEIKATNPDTTVKIKTHVGEDNILRFQRMYICWGVLKRGFMDGCRPLLGFDGCHLKGPSGGILLTAVGINGNNGMYHVAYAVVEKEKTASWLWFLELLIADLEIDNSYEWTVMSDKQKGLVEAVEQLLPDAEHRFCVMHLYSNFKLSHRGLQLKELLWRAASSTRVVDFAEHRFCVMHLYSNFKLSHRGLQLKELLWRAASSTRVVDFTAAMNELSRVDSKAFQWLAARAPQHWSRAYFSTYPKCDMLLNNLCESFNGMILQARDKPIISMLEAIRLLLMKRIHQQRDLIQKSSGILCPKIQKILDELKKKAMAYNVEWNGHDQFEVVGAFQERFTVHLGEKTCSCRKWDISGIPCKHAIAGMFYMHYPPEQFVVDCYKKETFLKAYTRLMNPMHGSEEWPKSSRIPLQPPLLERLPGRPKKVRSKQPGEEVDKDGKKKLLRKGTKNKCGICKEFGHYKSTCPKKSEVVSGVSTTTRKLQVRTKKAYAGGNNSIPNSVECTQSAPMWNPSQDEILEV